MDITRTVFDGIVLCIIFNTVVALFFFIVPQAYSRMFPKAMREAAAPYVEHKDVVLLRYVLIPLYILMFIYMAASARHAGVSGFGPLFLTGYTEMMFVNIGDFVLLDALGRIYVKDKGYIRGLEHHPSWEWKEWGKFAAAEHGIAWPLLVCPLAGLLTAGIGSLI